MTSGRREDSEKTGIVHDESDPSAGSRTTNMNASDVAVESLLPT